MIYPHSCSSLVHSFIHITEYSLFSTSFCSIFSIVILYIFYLLLSSKISCTLFLNPATAVTYLASQLFCSISVWRLVNQ
ncbi:hypothetical protein HOF65_08575 [bacterium]|nr:hypothetical protein [bacterium]